MIADRARRLKQHHLSEGHRSPANKLGRTRIRDLQKMLYTMT